MAGGSLFDNEQQPTKLTFANPKSVNALQWLGDLGSKYGVEPQPASLVSSNGGQLFYTGRVGMYIAQLDIEGMHSSIKGFSWDCAPLPSGSAGMWNFYGGADFGIVTAAKQHDLGWELLKYITSPAGQALLRHPPTGYPHPALGSPTPTPGSRRPTRRPTSR